ncbi:MAG: hypothetical protein CBC29_06130 [Methylococcaceae bacterium TMED69]|mgnify:CR=1 FL=1|nr:MAG: hypothetical protein CBC29_06130 [Methylococcaceae bacterium TMED69]
MNHEKSKIPASIKRKFPIGSCVRFKTFFTEKNKIGLVLGYLNSEVLEIWHDKDIISVRLTLAKSISKPYVKNFDLQRTKDRRMRFSMDN